MTDTFPSTLRYTNDHEWIDLSRQPARVGLTHIATEALGDVVFLELPETGTVIEAGEPCGTVESTKSVSDLFSPAGGKVVAVNAEAVNDPAIVNADPYEAGWLFELEVDGEGGLDQLLDAEAYAQLNASA